MKSRTIFARLSRATHHPIGQDIAYITNAKVACSNIKWSLMQKYYPEFISDITSIHDRKQTRFTNEFPKIIDALRSATVSKFSVVRHPRKRFISAYFDKMGHGREQRVWKSIAAQLGLEESKFYKPKEILLHMINSPRQDLDPHAAQQVQNLFWGSIDYCNVFHLESLAGQKDIQIGDHSLQLVDRSKHSTKSRIDLSLFDDETFSLIDSYYEDDYLAFGYTPESYEPDHDLFAARKCVPRQFMLDFLSSDSPCKSLKQFFSMGPASMSPLEISAVIDKCTASGLWKDMGHRIMDMFVARNVILHPELASRFVRFYTKFPK